MDVRVSKLREVVKDREAQSAAVHGVKELVTTGRLNNNNKFKEKVLNLIKLL